MTPSTINIKKLCDIFGINEDQLRNADNLDEDEVIQIYCQLAGIGKNQEWLS
ncbi:MAG: hypothetical protein LBQ00_06560 [Syntrophobacterales bacterium]|jgi:hypothetical protein|nr:hypothetical protein [Syntrophobacterales bacterium]